MIRVCIGILCLSITAFGQTSSGGITADEVSLLSGIFQRMMGAPSDPELGQRESAALTRLLRLDGKEAAALQSAASAYKAKLTQLRESEKGLSGKALTDADRNQLRQLVQQKDETVRVLATTLMNSLRPETVAQLRELAASARAALQPPNPAKGGN